MAESGAIRAGRAFVEMFASDKKLKADLRRIQRDLANWGRSIQQVGRQVLTAGLAGAGAFALAGKMFASAGDELAKMSDRTGVAVESLSSLVYAANQSGVETESLEGALRRMLRTVGEAKGGVRTAVDALDGLGISLADIEGMSPDKQFLLIADRIAQIEDPAVKTAAAMKVFGKSASDLFPFLKAGSQGVRALANEYLGLVGAVSEDDARAAEALSDSFTSLIAVAKRLMFNVGAGLAKELTSTFTAITKVVGASAKWLDANRETVSMVAKLTLGVVGAGVAILGLGITLSAAAAGLGKAMGALAVIKGVAGTAAAGLALLLNPIGLVTAAVVGLGAAVLYYSGLGGQWLDYLSRSFETLRANATQALKGIGDAMASGNIGLAAKILWLYVKLEWTRGINFLQDIWFEFKAWFVKTGIDMVYGMLNVVIPLWHRFEDLIGPEMSGRLIAIWAGLWSSFQRGWQSAVGFVRNLMFDLYGQIDDTFDAAEAKRMAAIEDGQVEKQIAQQEVAAVNAANRRAGESPAETAARRSREAAAREQEAASLRLQAEQERARAIQNNRKEIADAKRELDEATKQAAAARQAIADRPPASALPDMEEIAAVKRSTSVQGTFSAFEAQRSAGSDKIGKVVDETKKNGRILEQIRDQMRKNHGMVFTA